MQINRQLHAIIGVYFVVMISTLLSFYSFAQVNSSSNNSNPSALSCPSADDVNKFLKFASAKEVYVNLKKNAEKTNDQTCADKAEILGEHLRDLMLASLSADPRKICKVTQSKDHQQSFMDTLLTGHNYYGRNYCDVFK